MSGPADADLFARFQAFRQRVAARAPAPAPAVALRWERRRTPRGEVPVRDGWRPLSGIAAFETHWPRRVAAGALGPPSGWRWCDLETTGLGGGGGIRAFLVGIGWLRDGGLAVRQYLLEDLDREPALLCAVAADLAEATAVVTFNGKSFDWPLLRDRCVLSGVRLAQPAHWDVLHAARRLWGPSLRGGCQLSRLQEVVLREPRGPDLDGAEIPGRYRRYLEGDIGGLDEVVEHNLEDLRATAAVAACLCGQLAAGGAEASDPQALWGLARTYERAGAVPEAVAAYIAARRLGVRPGAQAAARLLKRQGRHADAAGIWEVERRGRVPSLEAAVELAKYLEHRRRDPAAALAVVREAMPLAVRLGAARRQELEHRLARLARKLGQV